METHSRKYKIKPLDDSSFSWFVNTAAIRMLEDELSRPELVNLERITQLAKKGQEEGTAFVAFSDDLPVGAIGGLVCANFYNPKITSLTELFWYVLPEYRTTRVGHLLIKSLEERAQEVSDELILSLLPHSDVNITALEKRGFFFEELGFRKKF
jgi:GNAT superfamily N-acetyltransferase